MPSPARYSVTPLALPRASDGTLAMLISLCALLFVVSFVPPFPEGARAPGDLLATGSFLLPLLLAAVLIERLVELTLRRRWAAQGRSRDEVQRTSFLLIGLGGLLVSVAGLRALEALLTPESLAALGPDRRALLIWTDLVITTGLIAGLADGFHKLVHASRSLLHRAPPPLH